MKPTTIVIFMFSLVSIVSLLMGVVIGTMGAPGLNEPIPIQISRLEQTNNIPIGMRLVCNSDDCQLHPRMPKIPIEATI